METLSLTDRQSKEICDNVGRMLVNELSSEEIRDKVEQTVGDYLKSKRINSEASDLTKKLDWSVNVRLKK